MSRAAYLGIASVCIVGVCLVASCSRVDDIVFRGSGGGAAGSGGSAAGGNGGAAMSSNDATSGTGNVVSSSGTGGSATGGQGGGGSKPFSCDDCVPPKPICVDDLSCADVCPDNRPVCHPSPDFTKPPACCAATEQCCTAAANGYPGGDLCQPAGAPCPIICPGGTVTCPGDQLCALDAETSTYSCVSDCNPLYLCDNLCCPLGSTCDQGACVLADLAIDADFVGQTAEIWTHTFVQGSCSFFEGCIGALGDRTLLRFSLRTPNIGQGDLFLGDPTGNDLFVYSPCHNHFHFNGYANYRLLDQQMVEVANGHKQAFCLLDFEQMDPNANQNAKYDCSYQGIQHGWADTYEKDLPCQWVDVTGVPPGDYLLEISLNQDHTLGESDYTNNMALVPVNIP